MTRPKSSVVLVGLLLVLLPTLAILQYRWIGEVSVAERDRLESSLRVASDRFASDLDGELARISTSFQIRNGFPEDPQTLFERYQAWTESATYPRLIRSVGLIRTSADAPPEYRTMDLKSGELQSAPAPKELGNLRDRFRPGPQNSSSSDDTMMLLNPIFRGGPAFGDGRRGQRRGEERRDEARRGNGLRGEGGRGEGRRGEGRRGQRPERPERPEARSESDRTRSPEDLRPRNAGPGPGGGIRMEGATLVELDRDVILRELVPALVERHFAARDETEYRVAIAAGNDKPQILYSSMGQWTAEDLGTPDASVFLFGNPQRPPAPRQGQGQGGGERRGGNLSNSGNSGRNRGAGPFLRIGFQAAYIGQPWQLLAKHRSGSLENAVEQLRKKNMAISFGIMLVLGAGLITVVISSQRARTLGRLQMEFAAGVSHELRTPLAVIRSAAYNLRRGVVQDKEGVEQYAAIVQDEARRLSDMVDQVLLYSETQAGRKKYTLAPVDLNEVIDRALTNLSPAGELEHCELTTNINPDLPPVQADASALTQCVQNLLSNALKYGKKHGARAEIEIAAERAAGFKDVQLSVTDHGPGIDPVDQRHLFEAFYRGEKVGSNVPGNGLGLHLVKRIMQAQHGRVTYSSAPQGGARFTLHIPAAQ